MGLTRVSIKKNRLRLKVIKKLHVIAGDTTLDESVQEHAMDTSAILVDEVDLLPVHDNVNALCIRRRIGLLECREEVFDISQ